MVGILIEWKWTNFVRAGFTKQFMFYIFHLVVVMLWNVEAHSTAR